MSKALQNMLIKFPLRLMSSARTPLTMSLDFARDLRNIYMSVSGAGTKRNGCVSIGDTLPNAENILKLMSYIASSGEIQVLAVSDAGKIYLQETNGSWVEKWNQLTVNTLVRWTHFAGKLILCNGVDPLVSWDGMSFSVIKEDVEDTSSGLTKVSTTDFTLESEEALYPVGRKITFVLSDNSSVSSTVSAVIQNGDITTVTLNDAILTLDPVQVFYEVQPPTFSNIYAAHDRLWGIGKGGEQSAQFSADVERSTIFYTHGVADETAWHDANGLIPYINLAHKMPVLDELLAMSVKDGLTAFFFRDHVQLWSGSDASLSGDFSWLKTMPLGTVHADLVMEMPNDVAFFTRYGVRTLSRILQTEQLDVGDLGSELDPSIAASVAKMSSDTSFFKQASACRFDRQGWFAFKPADECFVFQVTGQSRGWTIFDGLFKDASAFLNAPDGNLYLAKGGQLYLYDENVFSDAGESIRTLWWTPWLEVGGSGKRWANKYIELMTEQGANLEIKTKRYKNYNSSSSQDRSTYLVKASDYWDESYWDEAFFDNGYPRPEMLRDHFVADVFSYAFENISTEGPLTFNGFKLYGVKER